MKKLTTPERLIKMETEMKNLNKTVEDGFADIRGDIQHLCDKINGLGKKYTTKEEFAPVRNIAYGIVATVCLAVLGALIALVVR